MKEIWQKVHELGGASYYTGSSLRNRFLGYSADVHDVIIVGFDKQTFEAILGITIEPLRLYTLKNEAYRFRFVSDIRDLPNNTFTIDSIYADCYTSIIHDPYNGINDLKTKIIRIKKEAILHNPIKMLEACRLTAEIKYALSTETWFDLYENARILNLVQTTKIQEELNHILLLDKPSTALRQMQDTRLLEYLLPELAACENVIQSKRVGIHNVLEHILFAIDASERELSIRLTMLFHDVAKPQTLECADDGKIHFFKHEVLGAKIAKIYLKNWGYSREMINKVSHLVLHHMFDADPRLTEKSVRRLIKKVGKEHIYDLLKIREADRAGAPEKVSMKKIKSLKKKIDKEINNC